MPVFFLAGIGFSPVAKSAIFGDGNPHNGYEDDRVSKPHASNWPNEFRAVGRIFCEGRVQGSAVLLNNKTVDLSGITQEQPIVLTAKHLFNEQELADCHFAPESNEWIRIAIPSVFKPSGASWRLSGLDMGSLDKGQIQQRYGKDWVALELEPWQDWQKYALDYLSMQEVFLQFLPDIKARPASASMVGFDLIQNQIVVDEHCHIGSPTQTPLLNQGTLEQLFWDDCDSEQGSSGGALFVRADGQYLLVGIRVGSLFNRAFYTEKSQAETMPQPGATPRAGAKFSLVSNINVTRQLPIFSK